MDIICTSQKLSPWGQGLRGETSTGGAKLPGHLLRSARTLSPRPLASRALAAAGDRCSGTGRRARAEERQQVAEPRAQLCSYCVCLPSLRQEGRAQIALEDRATLRPHRRRLAWRCDHMQPSAQGSRQASRGRQRSPHGLGLLPSACRAHQDPSSTFTKIYKRSFCLLQAWLEDCYAVDFTRNTGLLGRLEDFISSKVSTGRAPEQPAHLRGRVQGVRAASPVWVASDRPLHLPRSCPWTAPQSTCWASWRWALTGGPRAPHVAQTWRTPRKPRRTPDLSTPSVRGSQKTASPGRWGPLPGGPPGPAVQPPEPSSEHTERMHTHAHACL